MARKTEGSALMKGPDSTEPALLIRMAIGPRAASAAVTSRLTSTTSVTSATPHPAASPAATTSRSGASVRPITVTAAPARASAAATARPMPRPPPVTKACLPASAIWPRLRAAKGIAAGPPYFKLKSFKLQACRRGYFKPKINPAARRRLIRGGFGGGMDEGSRHRRRPGRPLLRDPREEGLAADAHHRVRAQPARRHLRLRRRVLRRDARHLRGVRPRELSRHRRPLRLLGRHRNPFPWDDAPHRGQRVLRLLARHAVEDFGPARALPRRGDPIPVRDLATRSHHPRRRSRGGRRRNQFAHARGLRRQIQAERGPAAQLLLLDGLDAAVRRLHLLLPR